MTLSIHSVEHLSNLIKQMNTNDLRELVSYLSSDGGPVRRSTMQAMCYAFNTAVVQQSADVRTPQL